MTAEAMLSCRGVWKVYGAAPGRLLRQSIATDAPLDERIAMVSALGAAPACADVSFDVARGEIFVLMGLSGSGKSTVLRCLSRLVEPTVGAVLIEGENLIAKTEAELIEIRRRKMGMVFQGFGLMPHMTALENVAFPLRVQGLGLAERSRRAEEMLKLVELEGREQSYPRQLSGGQQQRVGIARSLVQDPDVWFLDEPFSALDPLIRRQMQDQLLHLQDTLHKTIVFVTHDINEAVRLADRIAIMKDGRIVQVGAPDEILESPADDYVAEFTLDARTPAISRRRRAEATAGE